MLVYSLTIVDHKISHCLIIPEIGGLASVIKTNIDSAGGPGSRLVVVWPEERQSKVLKFRANILSINMKYKV